MRTAKLCALLLAALALLLLPGCWGSRETDETAYVLAVGLDKGEKENLAVTVSIANPKVIAGISGGGGGGGGGEKEGKGTIVSSVETGSLLSAIDLINTNIDRRISLLHTKAFVFSEDLAGEGLGRWILPLNRYRELRATSQIFVCRGKAKDFIEKNNPQLELSPTKQFELINKMSQEHGLFASTQFREFYDNLKSLSKQGTIPMVALHEGETRTARPGLGKGGDATPGKYIAGEVPISGGNKAQAMGIAVFRGDRMVGIINGQETRYYLMLTGHFDRGISAIPDPLSTEPTPVDLMLEQARKPVYKISIDEDGKAFVNVDIYLEPEIISIMSGNNYENPELKPVLEEALSKNIEQGCHDLVRRTQEEFQSDIFGFGNHVKHRFLTIQSWKEFEWISKYPDAQVNVAVHTRIRRTGLLLKTSTIKE